MIKRKASCNGKVFRVHRGAYGFGYVGVRETIMDSELRPVKAMDGSEGPIMFTPQRYLQAWGWEYETHIEYPEIWVWRDGRDNPLVVWEGETRFDPMSNAMCPIINNWKGTDVIIGGEGVNVAFPSYDVTRADPQYLDTLETAVEAVEVSGLNWVVGTEYADFGTAAALLKYLFVMMQAGRGLPLKETISSAHETLLDKAKLDLYTLLWLRCASMILYDHRGETCIPLIKELWSVDGDGVVT